MPSVPNPPPNAVPYSVRVKAKKLSSGKYDVWIPGWAGLPRRKIKFSKNDLGMLKTQVHWVEFHLENISGASLRFHPDCKEVFWIKPGDDSAACPTSACTVPGIDPKYSCDDLLIVQNNNMSVEDYRFTINLLEQGDEGKDPLTYVAFDPGWGNRNGGLGATNQLTTQQAIGIVALGTAALAGVAWLLRGGGKGRGGGSR